ncbi:hypothetical protein [Oscillatoria sp. FACHB-1406]|uniref:hypothetical protein n=1 Tax=Oscillatoria sp. FACHB-1406 TaxID=2692846 RepID=UPI0018F00335|nr:hypothetical protein [Oscillatoria sp. FACHB-1406]
MTNTVGVLMFIGLFVTLVSVEAGKVVRTPLLSDSKKTPHFFEAEKNIVTYVDTQSAVLEASNLINSLPDCKEPTASESSNSVLYELYLQQLTEYETCLKDRVSRLNGLRFDIANYEVKVYVDSASASLVYAYERSANAKGESSATMKEAESDFNEEIAELDPQRDYLAFIVRPDSFEAFRAARQLAWNKGFDVGWEPMNPERAIVFGSGGRAVGVQ